MTKRKKSSAGATKRRKPLQIKKWLLRLVKTSVLVVIVVASVFLFKWLMKMDWQPMAVEKFDVASKLIYQDSNALNEVLVKFYRKSLFMLDVHQLNSEIELLPWVKKATVEKRWPGTLIISIVEHEPVARWNEVSVLNSDGKPLENPTQEMVLAKLTGPKGKAELVMDHYLQFSQIFSSESLKVAEVEMKPRGAWSVVTENGVQIFLGEKDVLKRSRRVVKVLRNDRFSAEQIEYIDARYPNGAAVKFKESIKVEVENDIAA